MQAGGELVVSGGSVTGGLQLQASNDVRFDGAVSANTLSASSTNGDIVQTAAGSLQVAAAASFTASSGDVLLASASNDFMGAVTAQAQDVALTDRNDLQASVTASGNASISAPTAIRLNTSNIVGNLQVQTQGAITQNGSLSVAGSSQFVTPAEVVLNDPTNAFGGRIRLEANQASVTAASSIRFESISVLEDLTLVSTTNSTNEQEAINLGFASIGRLSVVASRGDINLGTTVINTNMTLMAEQGSITQEGPLVVEEKTEMTASGAIDLRGPGNKLKKGVKARGSPRRVQGDLMADQAVSSDKVMANFEMIQVSPVSPSLVAVSAPANVALASAAPISAVPASAAPSTTASLVATPSSASSSMAPTNNTSSITVATGEPVTLSPKTLSVTVIENGGSASSSGSISIEGNSNGVTIRSADPNAPLTSDTEVTLSGEQVTFLVSSAQGESVEFTCNFVNGRLVIVASSDQAKQMVSSEKQLVIGAALTALQPSATELAQMSGIVLDLR